MPQVRMPDGTVVGFPDDMPPEQIKGMIASKFPELTASPSEDILKSGASGIQQGIATTIGLPGDLIKGAQWLDRTLGINSEGSANQVGFGSAEVQSAYEKAGGPVYEPKTTAGEYARTVGQFAPAALLGPGSLAKRMVTQAVVPGLASEAAGQATEGTAAEPYARAAGGLVGGVTGQALPKIAQSIITPHPSSPARQAAVNVLKADGITPTAGQATGDMRLMRKEAQRGSVVYASKIEAQNKQLTAAALKKVGINADKATPPVVNQFLDDIGDQFDNMAAQSNAVITPNIAIRFKTAVDNYLDDVPAALKSPRIEKLGSELEGMKGQALTGERYKTFRTTIDEAYRSAGQSETKKALGELKSILDDAVESGIHPNIKGAWKETRRNYRDWLALEKAIDPTTGMVTPASLQRSAVTVGGKRSYLRGKSSFTELANAADLVLQKPNTSGTAENLASIFSRAGIGGGIGATIGGAVGGPVGAGIGATAGAAYPMVSGRAMMTAPMQKYLANQLMRRKPWLDNPELLPLYLPFGAAGAQ